MSSDSERTDGPCLAEEFDAEAARPQIGIAREFFDFLLHNKKWWLLPIVLVLLLMAGLVLLAGSPAGPFIYTLF